MHKQKKYIFYLISSLCLSISVLSGIYIYRSTMTKWFISLPASNIAPSGEVLTLMWISSFAISYSAYLLTREEKEHLLYELGENLYLSILLLCLLWPICFFTLKSPLMGIIDMILIMFATFITFAVFFKTASATTWLMILYLTLMTFIFHDNLYIVLKQYKLIQ